MPRQTNRHPNLTHKTVLLIDRCQATCEVRAAVLRSHGIEVHTAEDLRGARFLWKPNTYSWIFLDVHGHLPGEAREFYEQIKQANPRERMAFFVGPPAYLSLIWPGDAALTEISQGQWEQTVWRFASAA